MPQTYQICHVTVTLPAIGTLNTDGSGNQIKHGGKCRVYLYAVQPDWRSGVDFEGFTVGWLTYEGYSESQFKRSQKIIMPDGYKLIALCVDERGIPVSWDSLPVQFDGGFISLKDADDTVRVRVGKIHGAEPFSISGDGEVFIKGVMISDGIVSANYSTRLNIKNDGREFAAGMSVEVEGGQSKVVIKANLAVAQNADSVIRNAIENVRQSRVFEQLLEASLAQQAEAIAAAVRDEIVRQCQPGGLIWRAAC